MVTASDQVSSSILPLASQRALLGVPQYLTRSCHETLLAEKDPPFHNIECSGADLPSARHKLDVSEVPSLLPWAGRQSQTIGSIKSSNRQSLRSDLRQAPQHKSYATDLEEDSHTTCDSIS